MEMPDDSNKLSEPGVTRDLSLGLPGDAEPLPPNDSSEDWPTEVNTGDDGNDGDDD